MDRAVAVIDIGMTNKKVAAYDERLRMIDSVSRTFDPIPVDGVETHDLAGMEAWFLDRLAALGRVHAIKAIAVTTHGATMVCVGDDGNPSAPCVYYTHEPGPEFQERFYGLVGAPDRLQAITGTPRFSALINPAKGILFLRERFPREFSRTRIVLNYPQYWGFRLTGIAAAEGTYTGCHSYLWDWERERYSEVAEKLGIADKMPIPLRDSWSVLGKLRPGIASKTGLGPDTIVTLGIHDSNASLLPHLAKRAGGDFVLDSTGTWCVLMHPQNRYGFAAEELGKVVFFNRSAFNKPVKTAIFLGGMEYETWSGLAAGGEAEPREDDYRAVLDARDEFILPEVVAGSGQFPGSRPRAIEQGSEYALADIQTGRARPGFLGDRRRAFAVLNLSLVMQTLVALERTGLATGTDVFIEGGFRKNTDYHGILAAALPRNRVYLTDIAEATSFGAAMTALAALDGLSDAAQAVSLSARFEIEYKAVTAMDGLEGFDAYRKAWLELVARP